MTNTNFVNLTASDVTLDGFTIAPSGQVATVAARSRQVGTIDGIPVIAHIAGSVTGLPDAQPDTVFIVTNLVRQALGRSRVDVVAVIKPTLTRDDQGELDVAKLMGA